MDEYGKVSCFCDVKYVYFCDNQFDSSRTRPILLYALSFSLASSFAHSLSPSSELLHPPVTYESRSLLILPVTARKKGMIGVAIHTDNTQTLVLITSWQAQASSHFSPTDIEQGELCCKCNKVDI